MDIYNKIEKLLVDTTDVGDVEQNLSQGNVDVIGGECPKGQQWCSKTKKCVPIGSGDGEGSRKKRNEEVVSGNVVGSSQSRAVGDEKEIEVLKTKVPGLVTRFNKLLGGYVVDDTNKQKKD